MRRLRAILWMTPTVLACATAPTSQTTLPDAILADSARIAWLESEGDRYEASDVVVWVPPATDPARALALTDTLNRGVIAAEQLVGAPLEWGGLGQDPVDYYLSPDSFISHASGRGDVFVSWWRVEEGVAPLKHEAIHEILAPDPHKPIPDFTGEPSQEQWQRVWPLWLNEGLADYLAQRVASEEGLPEGDVFQIGGLTGTDASCRERLMSPEGEELMPYLVGRGMPEQLFTVERRRYAPIYYACALSATNFLVDRIGLQTLVSAVRFFDAIAELERATGEAAPDWKSEWLDGIGFRGSGAG